MVVRLGSVAARMAAICCKSSSRATTIWLRPASCRKRAFSGVRMSVCVLACSWMGGQIQLQQAHVLNDEGVGASLVHLPGHAAGVLQLVVAQDGVERDEDAAAKAVGVCNQLFQLANVVACRGARTEGGAADIDSVGAVVHGFDADGGIARGGKEFDLVGQQRHRGRIILAR